MTLSSNAQFGFPVEIAQGLQGATDAQLKKIEISPSGYGIHFPAIDADCYWPAMMKGRFGTEQWMAEQRGEMPVKTLPHTKPAAARRLSERKAVAS